MKFFLALLLMVSGSFAFSADFPTMPDPNITPGKLCEHPDSYRYHEHIPYCNRSVSSDLKNAIIQDYDQKDGYNIQNMNRGDFKIDHFIPLSIGGANDVDNLWPQHKSVYTVTDPVEALLSDLMSRDKMEQKEAVEIIVDAKRNLDKVPAIIQDLQNRLNQ